MSVCTLLGSIYVDSMHYERLWEIKNGDLWQSSMDERGILLIKHEQKHLSLTDNENQPCSSSVACVELCEKRKYTAWCLAAFNFSLVPPYFLLPYFLENNLSYFTLTYTDPVTKSTKQFHLKRTQYHQVPTSIRFSNFNCLTFLVCHPWMSTFVSYSCFLSYCIDTLMC